MQASDGGIKIMANTDEMGRQEIYNNRTRRGVS